MKIFKNLCCCIMLSMVIFSFTSCGNDEDDSCITCSIAGETGPICSEDVAIWNEDTGSNLKTVSELADALEALGGSCN